ncbi:MAG TPA: archaeal proteasome endopeptidase complex subunit alpha [Candidatus Acidoferrum sp.]|nr:archaeal proteasome endopeptidase complex subunit alpha [Candidatus Acidoferrum sp.]
MYPQQTAYDRGVMWSPDGRLFQVEYAREAVKRGATAIGVTTRDSIVFVAHKNITTPLAIPSSMQKTFRIDSYIGVTYSGIVADGLHLINIMRSRTQTHRMVYNETQSVETIARDVSEELLLATQYGGIRPYAISVLIGGIDKEPRLYEIDPAATVAGYKADAIGTGKATADEMLAKEYRDDMSIDDAISLSVRIIKKLGEKQQLTQDNLDVATITRKDGYVAMLPDKVGKYL